MLKDSKRFASTGGSGSAQFDAGKPVSESMLATCFDCHSAITARDLVFTRDSP
jgi:Cytochrome P460